MDGEQPVSMSLLPAELREQCSGKGRDELPSHEATQSSRCHRLALNLLFFTAVCVWEGGAFQAPDCRGGLAAMLSQI